MADDNRGSWSARFAFITAATGSAVGLGNVWRFPNLCYTYGGGAFLVPYLLAMVLIGVPLLTLEFALGQVFCSGDLVAFGSMHPRLRGIGLGSIWCGFMVVTYYVAIIAWAVTMLVNSFRGSDHFDWAPGGDLTQVSGFFFNKVVGLGPQLTADGSLNRSTKIVPQTWVGVTFVWLAIYFCTFRGPKCTGRVTYVTMLVPFAMLIFLACYFGGLNGANDGVEKYIGNWDMGQITGGSQCGSRNCAEAWPDAIGQVFFSIGVTFGIMTAYASYNPRNQGVQVDALVVSFLDTLSSFIAGFAVFAGVGVLAKAKNEDVSITAGGSGGLSLVFISFPSALEGLGANPYNMSMDGRKTLAVLFWSMIVLLGIDSAFSLNEGFATCFCDSKLLKGIPREAGLGIVCLIGYSISLGYCNDTGLFSLDTVDYYVNISMLFVGFMECVAAGWVYMAKEQAERVGWGAVATMFGGMVMSSIVAPRVGLGIGGFSEHAENGTWTGILLYVLMMTAAAAVACRQAKTFREEDPKAGKLGTKPLSLVYDVLLYNVEELRGDTNKVVGSGAGNLSIPLVWSLLIKFFIPPVMLFMLELKYMSPAFGAYSGYHQWYQGWGIFVSFVPWLMFAVGLFYPSLYDILMPEKEITLREEVAGNVAEPVPSQRGSV